jgi:hypothetical protein
MARVIARVLLAGCILVSPAAAAFKLQALGAPVEVPANDRQARGFLTLFTSDVHERMTRLAYDNAGTKLAGDVIEGVRWNDNPPALKLGALFGGCSGAGVAEGLDCWTSMIRVDRIAWETLSRRERSLSTLRSHFGDMQFLHAMAASDGESAQETREKTLRWTEFAYKVARGQIGAHARMYGLRRGSALEPATAAWIGALFDAPAKQLWTVNDVFLPKGADLKLMAFGALLHTVEDSYSAAHVMRVTARTQANGCPSYDALDAIVEFHTYVGQDTEKHALCDDPPDWLESPRAGSPIDVLAEIVRAYGEGAEWPAVRAILEEKVLRLAPDARAARPGRCFETPPDTLAEDVHAPTSKLDAACFAAPR